MTLVGFPTAIEYEGTDFVTTDPAPIILYSPMVTPGNTQQFSPIHTLFLIMTSFATKLLSI